MRTTVTLDDSLLDKAASVSGISGRNELLREGLRALIERESARRLALLGGSDPQAGAGSRRRQRTDDDR